MKIDSQRILDSLARISDTIFADTADYIRRPKATLFVNRDSNIIAQVFENSKDTITAMTIYRIGREIFSSEFYGNGQYMCRFAYTEHGVRHGKYKCYYEAGRIRSEGEYDNAKKNPATIASMTKMAMSFHLLGTTSYGINFPA